MKALFRVLIAATLTTAATGCESFLDVNQNPNQATSQTPDALLASALTTTAANYMGGVTNYNTYASFATGYWGKTGTVSGFTEEQTYNYSNTYYQFLFNNTYDNLNNYDLIQRQGMTTGYPYHAAIARIMKVYNYLLLVDEYGDIPYTQALKGIANTTPVYDKAADIYKDFIVQLKGAVTDINTAAAVTPSVRSVGPEDVVFQGDMLKWKQFANSLRLRVLLRESQTNDANLNSSVAAQLTALQSEVDGFITTDVVVQPGYATNSNQQNPFYDRYGFAVGVARATAEYSFVMPTNYIIRQYVTNKDSRITQLYRLGQLNNPGTTTATPGYVGTDLGERQPPLFDPTDGATVGSRFRQGGTFLRGSNAPTVLMLLSEHLFSKAEAEARNLFTSGDAKADFMSGITASFQTTYRDAVTTPALLADPSSPTSPSSVPGVVQSEAYANDNIANPLVNFDLATSKEAKQSVILYQKYLAENTLASTEAWNDYRRTAQPKFAVSLRSASPRPDKLPTRLIYPQTEVSTNATNVPKGVDQFTKIFWDVLD